MAKKFPQLVARRGAMLKKFLDDYQTEVGAGRQGAFRDVVTDLFHIALRDAQLRKEMRIKKGEYDLLTLTDLLRNEIMGSAYHMFLDELENDEQEKITRIPRKRLKEHKASEFEFNSSKAYFRKRLKEEAK